ncbi:MAG: DUF4272 domain-containing protein [Clostridia bacterium]|nr:DUF4272 domain-containing protein [Clostridia bacterium]
MAIRFFKNLFRKHKKGHIGLTAEEAYAPLTAYPAWEETEKEEIRYLPCENEPEAETQIKTEADETKPAADPPAEKKAEEKQSPVSIWMYGFVEEREIAKTLIRTGIIAAFRSVSEDATGFQCRLTQNARVNVDISTDSENVSAQAGYLIKRFQSAPLSNRDVKNAALMQIEVFNAFAEFTLCPPYSDEDVAYLTSAVYKIAEMVCGFVLSNKAELFRWDKKLLVSEDGRTDFDEFMPIRRSGDAASNSDLEAADAARRAKSIEILQKHGVDIPADMPVQIPESKAKMREAEEIVNRLAALFACALKGQAFTSPAGISAPAAFAANAVKRLDNQYGVSRLFTPKEAEYIHRSREIQHKFFRLRMESCQVLLWALGLINIGWPSDRADTESLLRIIRDADTEMLLKIAKPRPLHMILSMHDVTYRLHSICVRTDEETLRRMNLDHDVIYERHYALNWLLTADGITDWDKVIPKT